MNQVQLISLDLDGTLLDPAGQITQASRDAIARARAAGVRVVINSGRSVAEAFQYAGEAGCDSLVSALGGAAVADAASGRVLRRWDVPEDSGRRVLELCLGRDIELMIFAGEEIVLDPFSKASLERTFPSPVFHSRAVVTDDPLAYLEARRLPLTKLHGDRPDRRLLDGLAALPGVQLTAANACDFELVAAGVDKGRALAMIALLYGVPLDRCAAVGDSDNDLAVLRAVGTPIAMGNAAPQVKAACRLTVPSNGEDGVAQAILSCLDR